MHLFGENKLQAHPLCRLLGYHVLRSLNSNMLTMWAVCMSNIQTFANMLLLSKQSFWRFRLEIHFGLYAMVTSMLWPGYLLSDEIGDSSERHCNLQIEAQQTTVCGIHYLAKEKIWEFRMFLNWINKWQYDFDAVWCAQIVRSIWVDLVSQCKCIICRIIALALVLSKECACGYHCSWGWECSECPSATNASVKYRIECDQFGIGVHGMRFLLFRFSTFKNWILFRLRLCALTVNAYGWGNFLYLRECVSKFRN